MVFPLLREGTKKGTVTANAGIKDSPKAAKAAVFLSSVETLLPDDDDEVAAVLEVKDVFIAGSGLDDTIAVSREAIAGGLDNTTELC